MWVGWVDVNGLEAWWVVGLMGGPLVSVDGLMGANTSVQTLVAKDCPGKYRHRRCLCLCLIFASPSRDSSCSCSLGASRIYS